MTLTLELTESETQQLRDFADERGLSPEQVVRNVVSELLATRTKDASPTDPPDAEFLRHLEDSVREHDELLRRLS